MPLSVLDPRTGTRVVILSAHETAVGRRARNWVLRELDRIADEREEASGKQPKRVRAFLPRAWTLTAGTRQVWMGQSCCIPSYPMRDLSECGAGSGPPALDLFVEAFDSGSEELALCARTSVVRGPSGTRRWCLSPHLAALLSWDVARPVSAVAQADEQVSKLAMAKLLNRGLMSLRDEFTLICR
jgi:hypothetical protein